ncbi:serine/threonine-protein kinase [Nakamurella panacisegetis]|uniref:serine/threonine-protein kinase n=1 Tax=Nakamurella panacisegetis TaxID=1090615 RepID=UPI0012FE0DEB|nr:serine/threonine-protein kinase [Nakamurella panacisegetis]
MSDPLEPTQSHPGPMASLAGVSEGTVLDGRYRLEELLGRGGTAEVYRATDELLGRAVAVKVFDSRLTDLNTVVRQRNEMRVLATLNHPNLIAVHDARIAGGSGTEALVTPASGVTSSGHTYLVMELVPGLTLADLLSRGPLPTTEVARLGFVLAAVLTMLHSGDLVHRDIKPANILVADSGQIKLGDFGLARILTAENRLTTGAEVMGTAAYFSPEQARGSEVGPSADIYSLGLVLLECLTGAKEFPGQPVEAAVARLLRDPVVPDDLTPPWPKLLTAMTDSNPARRPTAAQVADTLQQHFEATPAGHHPPVSTLPAQGPESMEAATAGWSTSLSPFMLTGDTVPARRHRRRAGLLLASGTGAAAIVAVSLMIAQSDATTPISTPTVVGATTRTPSTAGSLPGRVTAVTHSPATTKRPSTERAISPAGPTSPKSVPPARSTSVQEVAVVTSGEHSPTRSSATPTTPQASNPAASPAVTSTQPIPPAPVTSTRQSTPTTSSAPSSAKSTPPTTKAPKRTTAAPTTKPKKPKK